MELRKLYLHVKIFNDEIRLKPKAALMTYTRLSFDNCHIILAIHR